MLKKPILCLAALTMIALGTAEAQTKKAAPAKGKPAAASKAKSSKPVTRAQQLSYAIGLNIAQSIKQQGIDSIEVSFLAKAMDDVLKNKPTDIQPEEAFNIVQQYMSELNAKKGAADREKGEKFLAENKKKEGVKETSSGLQYEVIKEGSGEMPKATDKVKVHYHGTLTDGSVFDSSVERGQPAEFPVNGVIQGWQEALQLMKVGSKFKLTIPYQLAYGERGAGGKIGPYATLIFEVELLEIVK